MDIRNPRYNAFGTIDCEIKHSEYGWIPFTAMSTDTAGRGSEVWTKIMNGSAGPIQPYVEPPTPIDNRTFTQRVNDKLKDIDFIAKNKRDAIVAHYSAAEMASWPIKREEAIKYVNLIQSNPNADLAEIQIAAGSLSIEAQYRQTELGALVTKVLEKAQLFSNLEAAIAGYTGLLQDRVRSVEENNINALNAVDILNGWPV